ncbi:M3 family metallopeptidase [Salibacter halophilus]|uniref:oligopeptidase A n=1 Tax=Salibacter halophilus TaxID=1803916 RepID=A0A6N6M3Q5_9FLAO|nr:M3 family metallopeptidase [Salibacter halophilus]KAB1063785.1 M3 family metallopeptidase [Salibacter halophilus]
MSNILLSDFNTPFQTAPFDQIKLEDYKPAIEKAIEEHKNEIDAITANDADPTFENTIEALEFSGERLDRVTSVFFNLNSAETNDEMQAIAQEVSPVLTEHSNNILLNKELFERIKKVWETTDKKALDADQQTLLKNTYEDFVRNGAELPAEKQKDLRELNTKLAKLSLNFGENLLKETNDYELHITDESKIEGLPDTYKEAAKAEAKERNKDGFVFTLHFPSFFPFMTYVANRDLRKEMFMASGKKAYKDNDRNNEETVKEIALLRLKKAKLLGFESHAHLTLKKRMAESPQKVHEFLDYLLDKAKPAAENDVKEVAEFAKKEDGLEDLQRWDFSYYSEKLKKAKYEVDDEELKPYFKLENVIDGVFKTAGKLYDISFKERTDIPKYHKDIITYEVLDHDQNHLAIFYTDFFPRAGKRAGAWMTIYRSQSKRNGEEKRPHVSIVCNFNKPTGNTPSLLTFNEVTTLFHEFGHALHGILGKGRYPSITGPNVYWDFVELPSQLMENWCYEKECLDLFAKHYKTGEKIPQELVDRLKASATYNEGYKTIRQVSFGLLDMNWHDVKEESQIENTTVSDLEKNSFSKTDVLPNVDGTAMSTQFGHLFQGGYSAGYYSYKWAEVLDADAFEFFKENGIFDAETAKRFKENVLEAGGSEHPSILYKRFRGQEPDPDALLRRAGLME